MFNKYEVVKLKLPIPSRNLPRGIKGTVLLVYNEQDLPIEYEVEFLDKKGNTLAVITLEENYLEKM